MKAPEVKAAIARRHGSDNASGAWVCIEEAFSGFARSGGGIDVLALGVWQTAKLAGLPKAGRFGAIGSDWDATNPIVAYEVKVSRADMRRELYGYQPGPKAKPGTRSVPPWPTKQHFALDASHYFMFAVPKGLLKDEEINRREKPADGKGLWLPSETGLIEVDGGGCHVRVDAPLRSSPKRRSRHEVAELFRHVTNPNSEREARAALTRVTEHRDRLSRELEEIEDRLELEGRLQEIAA